MGAIKRIVEWLMYEKPSTGVNPVTGKKHVVPDEQMALDAAGAALVAAQRAIGLLHKSSADVRVRLDSLQKIVASLQDASDKERSGLIKNAIAIIAKCSEILKW